MPGGAAGLLCRAGMWRARYRSRWASHQTRLGEPVLRGRWASPYSLGEPVLGEPSNEVGASHQTRLGASHQTRLGEPVLRGRWASQYSTFTAASTPASKLCLLGAVPPARHCKCLLGTVPARHI